MRIFFGIAGVLAWLIGATNYLASTTVMQQQVGMLTIINGTLMVCAAAVISAIQDLPQKPADTGKKTNTPLE